MGLFGEEGKPNGDGHTNQDPRFKGRMLRENFAKRIANASSLGRGPGLSLATESIAQRMLDLSLARCHHEECRVAAREAEEFFSSGDCDSLLIAIYVDPKWFHKVFDAYRAELLTFWVA